MGRVKIKHPNSKDPASKRVLLEIIGPTVRTTRVFATHDALIALTGSDRDTDGIFKEDLLKRLHESRYEPIMPPELRCQRAVICFRLDEFITENSPAEIKAEVERCQTWAKLRDVYRFPRSNTIKITFLTGEMAEKACDQGLRMFYLSVPPHQMRRETYTHLIACDRCHALESHNTSECPKPRTYKRCSECSEEGHTYRECTATVKKCLHCQQEHSARAMRCSTRKRALREKEERLRRERAAPDATYAHTTAQASQHHTPQAPSLTFDALFQGHLSLMNAHYVDSVSPGLFQATL